MNEDSLATAQVTPTNPIHPTPSNPTRLSKAERRDRQRDQARREELLVTQT